jgi:hypothetical protein
MFHSNTLLPSPWPKSKPSKKPAEADGLLSSAFHLLLLVAYSSTLRMEVICSYEMSGSLNYMALQLIRLLLMVTTVRTSNPTYSFLAG